MFRRTVQQVIFRAVPKRNMGGHAHGHAVHYEGAEAVVRKYLPEDHHMALGIMGFYATLFLAFKVKSSFAKPAPAPKVETHSSSSGGIPSVDSEEFPAWLEVPGNLERLFTEA